MSLASSLPRRGDISHALLSPPNSLVNVHARTLKPPVKSSMATGKTILLDLDSRELTEVAERAKRLADPQKPVRLNVYVLDRWKFAHILDFYGADLLLLTFSASSLQEEGHPVLLRCHARRN